MFWLAAQHPTFRLKRVLNVWAQNVWLFVCSPLVFVSMSSEDRLRNVSTFPLNGRFLSAFPTRPGTTVNQNHSSSQAIFFLAADSCLFWTSVKHIQHKQLLDCSLARSHRCVFCVGGFFHCFFFVLSGKHNANCRAYSARMLVPVALLQVFHDCPESVANRTIVAEITLSKGRAGARLS